MMMREALTLAATQEMLAAVARHIVANVDALTAADQAIGDGDHGIGMRRGFAAVSEEMQKPAAGGETRHSSRPAWRSCRKPAAPPAQCSGRFSARGDCAGGARQF